MGVKGAVNRFGREKELIMTLGGELNAGHRCRVRRARPNGRFLKWRGGSRRDPLDLVAQQAAAGGEASGAPQQQEVIHKIQFFFFKFSFKNVRCHMKRATGETHSLRLHSLISL